MDQGMDKVTRCLAVLLQCGTAVRRKQHVSVNVPPVFDPSGNFFIVLATEGAGAARRTAAEVLTSAGWGCPSVGALRSALGQHAACAVTRGARSHLSSVTGHRCRQPADGAACCMLAFEKSLQHAAGGSQG